MEEFNRLRTKAAPPVPPALPKTIKPSQGRSVTAIEAGIPDRPTITPDLTTAACRRRTQVWYFRYNHISDKAIDCILSADMDRQSSAYQQAVKMVKEHATDLQTKTVGSQGSGWFVKHIESVVAEHDFRVHLNNIRRNQRFYEVISLGPESDVARRDREEKVFSAQVFYEEHKMRWADSIRNAISTTEESLAIESRTSTGSSKMQELIAERNRHKERLEKVANYDPLPTQLENVNLLPPKLQHYWEFDLDTVLEFWTSQDNWNLDIAASFYAHVDGLVDIEATFANDFMNEFMTRSWVVVAARTWWEVVAIKRNNSAQARQNWTNPRAIREARFQGDYLAAYHDFRSINEWFLTQAVRTNQLPPPGIEVVMLVSPTAKTNAQKRKRLSGGLADASKPGGTNQMVNPRA